MEQPQRIGKYEIASVLGEGGMGVVYKGYDPILQRAVAVKMILSKLLDHDQSDMFRQRFRNEAQAAGRLLHPNIVAVYEFNEEAGCPYIVMEFVEGSSLRQLLRADALLPEADVVSIMVQLLNALQYAHEHRVVHRDVKPANLLIAKGGRVKITDFGVARVDSNTLTRATSVIGSPAYMAPEQILDGHDVDSRADVFAAGALFHHLLTGQMPFTGTDHAVMMKVLNADPLPPSQVAPHAERADYDRVVARAMQKKPADRFASAAEFRDAIVACYRAPPSDKVSERTVLLKPRADAKRSTGSTQATSAASSVPAGGTAPSANGASRGGSVEGATRSSRQTAVAAGAGATLATAGGWDESVLSTFERELARCIGPVARVLVRRAAAGSTDVAALRATLASKLPPEQAATFMAAVVGVGGEATSVAQGAAERKTSATRAATLARPASAAGDEVVLSAELVGRLTQELIASIGPIGGTVARKAASRSTTRAEFVAEVAAMLKVDRADIAAKLARVK